MTVGSEIEPDLGPIPEIFEKSEINNRSLLREIRMAKSDTPCSGAIMSLSLCPPLEGQSHSYWLKLTLKLKIYQDIALSMICLVPYLPCSFLPSLFSLLPVFLPYPLSFLHFFLSYLLFLSSFPPPPLSYLPFFFSFSSFLLYPLSFLPSASFLTFPYPLLLLNSTIRHRLQHFLKPSILFLLFYCLNFVLRIPKSSTGNYFLNYYFAFLLI
jgi:hypothetical protein